MFRVVAAGLMWFQGFLWRFRSRLVLVFLQDSSFVLGEELGLQSPAHTAHDPAPSSQDPSFLSTKGAGPSDDLDLSFLPDELSTQDEASRGDTGMTSLMT